MTWTNPLDKIVPIIRQDYANHVIYGGLLGLVLALIIDHALGKSPEDAWWFATFLTMIVSYAKKIIDHSKENESIQECVSKAAITVTVPTLCWVSLAFHWW